MIHQRHPSTARRSPHVLGAILLGGAIFAAWPSLAHAQVNPFRGYKGPTLSKEDYAAGNEAARKLLNEDHAELGKSEQWTNPTSGNTGTITVEKNFHRQGMDCRALKSEVRFKRNPSSPRAFNLNVCQLHSGEWKVL